MGLFISQSSKWCNRKKKHLMGNYVIELLWELDNIKQKSFFFFGKLLQTKPRSLRSHRMTFQNLIWNGSNGGLFFWEVEHNLWLEWQNQMRKYSFGSNLNNNSKNTNCRGIWKLVTRFTIPRQNGGGVVPVQLEAALLAPLESSSSSKWVLIVGFAGQAASLICGSF